MGLTDAEVARRLGLSQSRYANYVVNKREPDFATFIKICRVLATTPDMLLNFGKDHVAPAEVDRLRQEVHAATLAMGKRSLRTLAEVANALAAIQDSLPIAID